MKNASLLGLSGLALGALVVAISHHFFPLTLQRFDPVDGYKAFSAKCAGCHGVDPGGARMLGPSLAVIGQEASTRKDGLSGPEYLLESIYYPDAHQEPGVVGHMPADTYRGLSIKTMRNLVYFLASQGASPDLDAFDALNFENKPPIEDAPTIASVDILRKGWHLFSNELGCNSCHSIFGEPGSDLLAPSLKHVSQLSKAYVVESIRHPSQFLSPGYQKATVTTKPGGESINGRVLDDSAEAVVLLINDDEGLYQKRTIAHTDIENIVVDENSSMPPYSLSTEDEKTLLDFFHYMQSATR